MSAMGRFITLEGGEGAGKSTQIQTIRDFMQDAGIECVFTREPGGTPVGEAIRRVLLDKQFTGLSADAELLMVFAARAEHLAQVILPALRRGAWVISDRFTDASYAYQGGGRGIDMQRIAVLEQWVQAELRPDLTLLLDCPFQQGLSRAGQRGEKDRFESEAQAFFERVRQCYLQRAESLSQRFVIIDASLDAVAVSQQVREALTAFLAKAQ